MIASMSSQSFRERVLVVDEDPEVLDLLSRQVLEPMGYRVATANDAGEAIQQALSFSPDLILASLTLPGLSGKDLLVALQSQGLDVPVLVTAPEGMEADAIQAFRLGARDYLVKPLREAEVVAAIERAGKDIRLRNERENLANQLEESNQQLARRVDELTAIYDIGKAVVSLTHQGQLFDHLMRSSLRLTKADMGWLLLQREKGEQLVLRAQKGMPDALAAKLHQTWDDGVSSLVLLSGEPLVIHGEGLRNFKLARMAKAALIVPIKAREQPIGVLTVARKAAAPFDEPDSRMLGAIADYASISLVNARLFQALEARAESLQVMVDETQHGVREQQDWVANLNRGVRAAREQIGQMISVIENPELSAQLKVLAGDLDAMMVQIEEMPQMQEAEKSPS
jgi:two-component system NtrC family sensor kinase